VIEKKKAGERSEDLGRSVGGKESKKISERTKSKNPKERGKKKSFERGWGLKCPKGVNKINNQRTSPNLVTPRPGRRERD